VHKGSFAAKLVFVLLAPGCSAVVEPPTGYTTVEVNTKTQSDAVHGLGFDNNVDYPMLYYESTGIRRLNQTSY
jgi:hypothetical protein